MECVKRDTYWYYPWNAHDTNVCHYIFFCERKAKYRLMVVFWVANLYTFYVVHKTRARAHGYIIRDSRQACAILIGKCRIAIALWRNYQSPLCRLSRADSTSEHLALVARARAFNRTQFRIMLIKNCCGLQVLLYFTYFTYMYNRFSRPVYIINRAEVCWLGFAHLSTPTLSVFEVFMFIYDNHIFLH